MAPVRRGRRFPVAWPLQYRSLGAEAWLPARTVNMSISGVLFRAAQPSVLAEDLELRIVMEAPDIDLPATFIEMNGRVVRRDPTLEGAVAVEFQSVMSFKDRRGPTLDPAASPAR
jgi:PilZ domain